MELPSAAVAALEDCFETYSDVNWYGFRNVMLVWAGERPATSHTIQAYDVPRSEVESFTEPYRRFCDALGLDYSQTVTTVSDDRAYNNIPADADLDEELAYVAVTWDIAADIERVREYNQSVAYSTGEFLGYPDAAIAEFGVEGDGETMNIDEVLAYGIEETTYSERDVRVAREYVPYAPTRGGYDEFIERGRRYRETIIDICEDSGLDASKFLRNSRDFSPP